MIKLIYKLFKRQFHDLLVEEFYGFIPKDVKEPSIEFLRNGSERLEKFFLIQAYHIQRKAVSDVKNIEKYHGMLVVIKSLVTLINSSPIPKSVEQRVDTHNELHKKSLEQLNEFRKNVLKENI